jgi:redox-sensing transcriptional repressor
MSEKLIGRLSLYRRLLAQLKARGESHVFSHQLAGLIGGTAAQVRRDIMDIGFAGSPARGYEIDGLIRAIGRMLDGGRREAVVLVGIGNLGRAIMAFFESRRPNLAIVAAFDAKAEKAGRVIHGCRCYTAEEMADVIAREQVRVGIIAVPASQAQAVADALVRAGVRGILNFAPVPLRVPGDVYVEEMDMTMSLEKVAYFARQGVTARKVPEKEGVL